MSNSLSDSHGWTVSRWVPGHSRVSSPISQLSAFWNHCVPVMSKEGEETIDSMFTLVCGSQSESWSSLNSCIFSACKDRNLIKALCEHGPFLCYFFSMGLPFLALQGHLRPNTCEHASFSWVSGKWEIRTSSRISISQLAKLRPK